MPEEIDEVQRRVMQLEIERTSLEQESTRPQSSASAPWIESWPRSASA